MPEKYQKVQHVTVKNEESGRRIDNFLFSVLKQVPKTRIYKMLRKGEVRINGSRVRQSRKVNAGDVVRIPPVHMATTEVTDPPEYLVRRILDCIIFEDDRFLAINKPGGISVHSGSRDPHGVIEALRAARPDCPNLQLAHRLDRMTSGILLLCKQSDILRQVHAAMKTGKVSKKYLALVKGAPADETCSIDLPLKKGVLKSGEHMVEVDSRGKDARSVFHKLHQYPRAALMEVELVTGRTHQIRVHASHAGHPLAMDNRYGDPDFNRYTKRLGLKRMFLHASSLEFRIPLLKKPVLIHCELPDDLQKLLENSEFLNPAENPDTN